MKGRQGDLSDSSHVQARAKYHFVVLFDILSNPAASPPTRTYIWQQALANKLFTDKQSVSS
jgi:hypothetical protein